MVSHHREKHILLPISKTRECVFPLLFRTQAIKALYFGENYCRHIGGNVGGNLATVSVGKNLFFAVQ